MYLGQQVDLAGDGTHGAGVAAINTRLAGQDALAYQVLLDALEHVLDLVGRGTALDGQRLDAGLADLADTLVAGSLVGDAVGFTQVCLGVAFHGRQQFLVDRGGLPLPAGLAGLGNQFIDGLDDHLHFLVGKQYGAQHLVLAEFLGLGLNHQYRVLGTGDHHVQLALGQLGIGGVQQVAVLLGETDPGTADGAIEGAAGNRQGGGGADHGGNIRIDVLVGGHDRTDNLYFVHEAIGEQRADGTVDQAGSQGFLFTGTRFTLEKAAGDFAHGIGLFSVVHGQREKVTAFALGLFCHHGAQHRGIFDGYQHSPGSLARDAAGLQGDCLATVLECFSYWIHNFSPILYMAAAAPGQSVWLQANTPQSG